MKQGDIYLNPAFEFTDGFTTDKYLIVLNTPANEEPFLLALTTSQSRNKYATQGCYVPDGYYHLSAGSDWFPKPTWILFYALQQYDRSHVLGLIEKGKLKHRGCLRQATVNAIINCLKQSFDINHFQRSLLQTAC